jgi:simple sugar transport system permease protein
VAALREAGLVALSVAAGLAVGGAMLAAGGANPLRGLYSMLTGLTYYPEIFVVKSSVLVLTALAFAIPLRVGFFNIGGEGQLYAGAGAALVVAMAVPYTPLPALVAAAAAGAALGGLAGALRVKLGVNEVLSTIMLNWVVYWSLAYLVIAELSDPVYPHLTREVPEGARLPAVPPEALGPLGDYFRGGLPSIPFVSVAVAAAAWWFMYRTLPGLRYRFAGANEYAAASRGVNVDAVKIASMVAAGALAGLAGGLLMVGYSYRLDTGLSGVAGYGFEGIGAALIGRNHPLGIVAASMFIGDLAAGSERVQVEVRVPAELADVVNGTIIFVVAALSGLRYVAPRLLGVRAEG